MRRHPRSIVVNKAKLEISEAIYSAIVKHDLTYLELISILSSEISGNVKYALRHERHPDNPDKGADEE